MIIDDMLDNQNHLYNEKNGYGRFFLLRMLFKHIELFNLWKKSTGSSVSGKPASSLYEITLELLEEIQRLQPSVKIKSYKKVAGKFALSISDLANASSPKESLPKFYFHLYVLHRKLHASLTASNSSVKYNQAVYLHFITSEIIAKVCSLDNSIKASMYQREIAILKETFAENTESLE